MHQPSPDPTTSTATSTALPPHDSEIEQAFLGGILNWSEQHPSNPGLEKMAGIVKPEHLYSPNHQAIYRAMLNLHSRAAQVTVFSLKAELQDMDRLDPVGGLPALVELVDMALYAPDLREYARIILECYRDRQLAEGLTQLGLDSRKRRDAAAIVGEVQELLVRVAKARPDIEPARPRDLIGAFGDWFQAPADQHSDVTFCIQALDAVTGLLPSARPTIVAARPGKGKTILGFQTLRRNAERGIPCLGFNLEMEQHKILARHLSAMTGVAGETLSQRRSADLTETEWDSLGAAMAKFADLPMFMVTPDHPLGLLEIEAQIRFAVETHGIKLAVVDQLSKIEQQGRTLFEVQTARIQGISRIQRQVNIPIIVLCQVNRAGAEAPTLEDLKGTGAIEEDAGLVLLLHPSDGQTKVIIAKNDSGQTGVVDLNYAAWKYTIG